jgi:hypothetical protein
MANVYVVIYATINGKTGHAGIAVDNYRVQTLNGRTDTVADGTLTYYDLWPGQDDFRLFHLSKNMKGKFYKLPNAIWPGEITLNSLYDNGIPHREYYPCDGLLMLRTAAGADQSLKMFLDSVIECGRSFNARFYNCSDFVLQGLCRITGQCIRAKEFLPFAFSSTPNKLCRKLMKRSDVVVVKSPGEKINGSFLRERIIRRKPPPTMFASN